MSLPGQRQAQPARPTEHPLTRALARATAVGTIAARQAHLLGSRLLAIGDAAERRHATAEEAFLRLLAGGMASGLHLLWAALRPDRPQALALPIDADDVHVTMVMIWAAGLTERLERYRSVLRGQLPAVTDEGAQVRVAALDDQAAALLIKVRQLERDLLAAAGITGPEVV